MAADNDRISINEIFSLVSLGINPQYLTSSNVTMESEKYICVCSASPQNNGVTIDMSNLAPPWILAIMNLISPILALTACCSHIIVKLYQLCVRETSPQNSVVIIDMSKPKAPQKKHLYADSAIMNPVSPILALKAQLPGTTQDRLQIYNLATNAYVKSHQMPEQLVYWKWITPKILGMVTQTSVYHWTIEDDSEPVKKFDRTTNLSKNQIINYECDPSEKWLVLVGIAPGSPERPQLVKGNMQLFSVDQQQSQALEAHAASFASFKVPGNETPILLCFATKSLNAGEVISRLNVIELDAQPGRSSLSKIQKELVFHPDSENDFPVGMQISHKYGYIFVTTKLGLMFLYDLETAGTVYRTRISRDPILLTCAASSVGGIFVVNSRGQVILASVNESTITHATPLFNVRDRFRSITDLTHYFYCNKMFNNIHSYVQINPGNVPSVVGQLLDDRCSEEFIRELVISNHSLLPIEPLVEECEKRNRLLVLTQFLRKHLSEGSQDVHVHNAWMKLITYKNRSDPEYYLTTNPHYDSLVVGKYCERDPLKLKLAVVAYDRGQCDHELIDVTSKNSLFDLLASYVVKRMDGDLWKKVLNNKNEYRRQFIDQVVSTALPESKNSEQVSAAVTAFTAAGLYHELIQLNKESEPKENEEQDVVKHNVYAEYCLGSDMLMEIFLLLPARTVMRVELVCKEWYRVISDPLFKPLHWKRHIHEKPTGLVVPSRHLEYPDIKLVEFDTKNPVLLRSRYPTDADVGILKVEIEDGCNGLFLLSAQTSKETRYYLWNPTTRQSLLLPKIGLFQKSSEDALVALIFDPVITDTYKVLYICRFGDSARTYNIGIYSSETCEWRAAQRVVLRNAEYFSKGIYWNNAFNWPAQLREVLLYFDMDKETVKRVELPPNFARRDTINCKRSLFVSEDRLLLVNIYLKLDHLLKIYQLHKDGMWWSLDYTVDVRKLAGPFPESLNFPTGYKYEVLAVTTGKDKDDAYLILELPNKVVRLDISGFDIEVLLRNGFQDGLVGQRFPDVYPYIQSFYQL